MAFGYQSTTSHFDLIAPSLGGFPPFSVLVSDQIFSNSKAINSSGRTSFSELNFLRTKPMPGHYISLKTFYIFLYFSPACILLSPNIWNGSPSFVQESRPVHQVIYRGPTHRLLAYRLLFLKHIQSYRRYYQIHGMRAKPNLPRIYTSLQGIDTSWGMV